MLIDIDKSNILANLFQLPFTFITPDLLFYDELAEQHGHLLKFGLQLEILSPEIMERATHFANAYKATSRYDCMALAVAEQHKIPLLTGDKALRKAAAATRVTVYGTIWLVEQMITYKLLTIVDARLAYEKMRAAGSILPWQEAETRLQAMENPYK